MDNIIVRARVLAPTNTLGTRISVRSQDTGEIVPVNYGWRTDSIRREAIAECWGVPIDEVRYSMEHGGWGYYIVNTSVVR